MKTNLTRVRTLSPVSDSPAWGVGIRRALEHLCLKAGAPRTRGNTDCSLRGHTQSFSWNGTQDKAVTPQEPQPDLPTGPGGSPGQAGGVLDLTVDKAQVAEVNFLKLQSYQASSSTTTQYTTK